MEKLQKLYTELVAEYHNKVDETEEYMEYMEKQDEFCQNLSEEQLIEFEQLMDKKLEFEDNECFSLFKNAYLMGIAFTEAFYHKKGI